MYYKTRGYKVFSSFNYTAVIILSILCVLPLLHILAVSFSSKGAASGGLVTFWPIGFNINSYILTFENKLFLGSLWNSVERALIGVSVTLGITMLAAYPLSLEESEFKGRTIYTWLFVFTMLFSGGLIPSYIVVQKVGIMDTIWALVLPGAVAVFLIVLMLNFFRSVPKALAEAAYIDGASHIRTLISIYIPISVPAIATISLFSLVGHWNSWFDGLLYITNKENYPMATLLQLILAQIDPAEIQKMSEDDLTQMSERTVKSAQIFIATIPIIMAYPFLQRYFVHGIKLGSVKE